MNHLYQSIVEPFASLSLLHTLSLSLFLALLPLLDAHFNHGDQKPNLLTLAWITIGLCSLGMLALLAFSPLLQRQIDFSDLLGLQIVAMAVILVFHLGLMLCLALVEKKSKKHRKQ